MAQQHFADRYIEAARALGTPLCVGLDPHLELIPREFGVDPSAPLSQRTAQGVLDFLSLVVEECTGRVAAVKPQIAFFEQLGFRGLEVLEELLARVRSAGLLVLLDAKRGDIGSTAEAYARAFLLPDGPYRADALTVNAYLGLDSLAPFLRAAEQTGAGLFVLTKTSNPGSADFQDQRLGEVRLFERVAQLLRPHADALLGESGWSSLGIVVGATFPADAVGLRQLLPRSLFLLPGFGVQGAEARSALAPFVRGPAGLEGGLVSSSRGLLFGTQGPGSDVRAGFRARLEAAIRSLSAHGGGAGA